MSPSLLRIEHEGKGKLLLLGNFTWLASEETEIVVTSQKEEKSNLFPEMHW